MNKKGLVYENIALDYLKNNGYEIIDRNFSVPKMGEIDIIAIDNNWLVFIEVKARKKTYYSPYEAVNSSKAKKIIKTSIVYIKNYHKNYNGIRYDIISIEDDGDGNYDIYHIKDAIKCDGRYYF